VPVVQQLPKEKAAWRLKPTASPRPWLDFRYLDFRSTSHAATNDFGSVEQEE
jgi:hypothetical protein